MKRSRNHSQAKIALKDLLSAVESWQSSSEEITAKVLALRQRFNVPGYCWTWAEGYQEAIRDKWYREKLVFCRVWKGTIIPCKWDNLPEDLKDHIRKGGTTLEGHYWLNRDGSVGKPYFTNGESEHAASGRVQ